MLLLTGTLDVADTNIFTLWNWIAAAAVRKNRCKLNVACHVVTLLALTGSLISSDDKLKALLVKMVAKEAETTSRVASERGHASVFVFHWGLLWLLQPRIDHFLLLSPQACSLLE